MLNKFKKLLKTDKMYDNISQKKIADKEFYHTIPRFTKEEMENAEETSDKDFMYDLYRQALNGYAGYYQDKWLVGTAKDGMIKKVRYDVYAKRYRLADAIKRIEDTQSKARYGKEMTMKNNRYCKLSYDLEDQEIFALHVTLTKEYIENEIYTDAGTYGGIHFGSLKYFEDCLDFYHTSYGNKLIMIQPLNNCVYYNYMSNVYVGEKVFVERVLYLDDPATWEYLNELDNELIERNKDEILAYLQKLAELDKKRDYSSSITFVLSILNIDNTLMELKEVAQK